jgi:outer membrane protein assembly factor BamB
VTGRANTIALAWLLACASAVGAWETRLTGTGNASGDALAVAVLPGGDVVAAGHVNQADTGDDFTVVRLGGGDGTERWRTIVASPSVIYGETDEARAVAVDDNGDVVAAGQTSDAVQGVRFTVVKLSGTTGAVLWRYDTDGLTGATTVLVDGMGDVYAGGRPTFGARVVKLAGDSGVPIWTFQDPLGLGIESAALLPGQDVVVSELFNTTGRCCEVYRQVIRLDRSTGTPVWTTPGPPVDLPQYQQDTVASLASTPSGDVFVVALGEPIDDGALRLAGDNGQVLWTRTITGSPDGSFIAGAIAATSGGDLAVWGEDVGVQCSAAIPPLVAVRLHFVVLARTDGATVVAQVSDERTPSSQCQFDFGTSATSLAVAPTGDAYVVWTLVPSDVFMAARLSGSDLHEVWRRGGPARVPGVFLTHAVAGPTANGLIVAGSAIIHPGDPARFAVLNLDAANGAVKACGDATVDPGEACDDGTLGEGTCCAADCGTAQPDGTPCDDGSVCTLGDRCSGGLCAGTSRLPCEPCGSCNDTLGCLPNNPTACARSTVTDGGTVAIARKASGRTQFGWTLRSGPATQLADLGDPLTTTGYAVCGMSDGRVVLRATAPAGMCGGRPCWKRSRRGFEYVNPAAPDGLSRLSLRAGGGGRSRFHASGDRKHLLAPNLPINGGLTVELLRTDQPAMCWSADHETVLKNNTRRFRAKGH